jgi:iron-sulfur cluster assembly protein
MLMLTRDAAEAVKGLAEAPGAEGLRISTVPPATDARGPRLQVALAPGPDPQDAVVEAEGARIFLAPDAAPELDDKVLDADIEAGEVRFAVLQQGDTGEQE